MKRILAILALAAATTFAAVLIFAFWPTSTRLIEAGDTSSPEQIEAGRYAAIVGDCVACHTAPGGKPFAGGLPIASPIGAIYTTNITPDRTYGIGDYTLDDFDRAVRHGVARNGNSLYPAMPYPSYARVSDTDIRAMYAYFMHGVTSVAEPNKVTIPWPLSIRWPVALWRKLFAPKAAGSDLTVSDTATSQDPAFARGAYLVEGLGHCGACHSPRGMAFEEKGLTAADAAFLTGGAPMEGWVAKSLRGDGLDGWNEGDLVQFLKTGRNADTAVFGGMTDVVRHSLQFLSDDDLTAIARYLTNLPPTKPGPAAFQPDPQIAQALWKGDDSAGGAQVYIDNCAACHRTDGKGYTRFFPALGGNTVVRAQDPTSLIGIVLNGYTLPGLHSAPSSITMPPFGWRLNDQEVADVVSFIRTSWGNRASPITAAKVTKLRRPPQEDTKP